VVLPITASPIFSSASPFSKSFHEPCNSLSLVGFTIAIGSKKTKANRRIYAFCFFVAAAPWSALSWSDFSHYGSVSHFNSQLQIETIKRVLTGVVAASSLLHFITTVLSGGARKLDSGIAWFEWRTAEIAPRGFFMVGFLHGAKWATAFVVPLGALWLAQVHSSVPACQRTAWIVKDLPGRRAPTLRVRKSLQQDGQLDAAPANLDAHPKVRSETCGRALPPGFAAARSSKLDAALRNMKPRCRWIQKRRLAFDYSYTLERLGRGEEQPGKLRPRLRLIQIYRGHFTAQLPLQAQGKLDDAISDLRKAVEKEPTFIEARFALAQALLAHGDFDAARSEFETVVKQAPGRATQ